MYICLFFCVRSDVFVFTFVYVWAILGNNLRSHYNENHCTKLEEYNKKYN